VDEGNLGDELVVIVVVVVGVAAVSELVVEQERASQLETDQRRHFNIIMV